MAKKTFKINYSKLPNLPRTLIFTLAVLGTGFLVAACQVTNTTSNIPRGEASKMKIAVMLPLTGISLGQTQAIVNSIKQALDETEGKICGGKIAVELQIFDDATIAAGKWDPAQVTANANKVVADPEIVAAIGHYNSGAAKLSIPILNQSNLVMVSPANTYTGLTKAGQGDKNEPEVYYLNGKRNFARVVPADDLQGSAAANWTKNLGVKKVYILDDQELYGKGVADVYEQAVKKLGIEVLGREGIEAKAPDYQALMTKIKALNPEMIYFGGTTQNNVGQLLKDMHSVGMTTERVKFMGPDGTRQDALINAAGNDAEGIYATFGGLPPKELTGDGQKWYVNYKNKFNSEPSAYAAYGYESAKVVLAALGKVCKLDRAAVRDAVMQTKNFAGISGIWSFDANGDTSLKVLSGNVVKGGKWEFVQVLNP